MSDGTIHGKKLREESGANTLPLPPLVRPRKVSRSLSLLASMRGTAVTPETKAAASSRLNTPMSFMKSRVSTSTVTGTFTNSCPVRLPRSVEVALHLSSTDSVISKGESSTTSFNGSAAVRAEYGSTRGAALAFLGKRAPRRIVITPVLASSKPIKVVPASIASRAARGVISPFTAWVRMFSTASAGKRTSRPDCSESRWSDFSAVSAGRSTKTRPER